MNKKEKVMATLELLLDYLTEAKNQWEGEAYQAIGLTVSYLSGKKANKKCKK